MQGIKWETEELRKEGILLSARKASKKYRETHKESTSSYGKEYWKENKERLKPIKVRNRVERQERQLLGTAKRNARIKGLPFNLEISDLIVPETCIFLGCKLTRIYGQGRVWTNASLDRIDPTKGYVKGNIQIISELANRMKQNATQEQLVIFATNILKNNT